MSGEKTEKPTPKRRKEARKEGQVPRTPELGAWLGLLAVTLALGPLLDRELGALRELLVSCLVATADPSIPLALALLREGAGHTLVSLLVLSTAMMLIGVAAALGQGGFFIATKMAKPSLKKLDPIKGAKRVFGPHALWEGAKMLIKSSLVGVLAYGAITGLMPLIGGLVPVDVVLGAVADSVSSLLRTVALAGLLMAAADYAIQRRRVGRQTRMSKEEIKQEHKQQEGDPLVKSQIRSRQLAAARSRMLADVADADVLLVNPTHVAIALKYDAARGAPRVVARGAGAIATRIRERAAEAQVPMVRDVPLARSLYRSTQVGQEIPRELFAAVAQVLAFVISRRNRGHHGGVHATPRGRADLPPVAAGTRRRRPIGSGAAGTSR